jgi:hypothetical protein
MVNRIVNILSSVEAIMQLKCKACKNVGHVCDDNSVGMFYLRCKKCGHYPTSVSHTGCAAVYDEAERLLKERHGS